MEIKNVAIIGSGTMGHGIAEVFAIYGYNVRMEDISDDILNAALKDIRDSLIKLEQKNSLNGKSADEVMSKISTFTSIEKAVKDADLVIEAVPEIEDLKKRIFSEVEKYAKRETIIASNTSNIRITDIAKNLKYRDRIAGMHFFNPPPLMKLVEVIKAEETSDDVIETLVEIVKKIGKYPLRVMKDTPGFVVNRINAPESLLFCLYLDHKVASPEEIDAYFKAQGLPMGPYELMDYVGIDVVYDSMEYFTKTLHKDYGKCKTIRELYKNKQLGKKTGKGFYDWSKGRPTIDLKKATDKVSIMDVLALEINEAVKLIEEGVANPEDIENGVKYGMNRPYGPISVAKSFTSMEIKSKLEELSKKYDCEVFAPANAIKNGMLRDAIEGRLKGKEETKQKEITQQKENLLSTEQFKTIKIEKYSNKIAKIILNRPKYNLINGELLEEMEKAIKTMWNDPEINVVIITGEGNVLSAGADLNEFVGSSFQFLENSRKGERVFQLLSEIPKLTIAVMKGFALGGGFEMSLACDLRVGTEDVQIGFPEVTLGLVPGWGGTQRLSRIVGLGKAMELIVTSERINGKEAFSLGILNRIYKNPDEEVIELAKSISEKSAPIAVAMTKRLLNKGAQVPIDVGLEMESFANGVLFSTEDLKEGVMAFLQKRKAEFKGR
ncbi:MAG: 3-hydroxyacyl-CoA dehydrogenase NAD-binding domain-containing protein [Caldisphaera sp.]|jgi:enoyl-CoA hydratase/3-hydroxyacyl-CoA dehydrogenase|nr:3-hydroxyacyl-CoA dehydrogenase/enoyl-CoA hydratase family protein [Caldisphaera sp.]